MNIYILNEECDGNKIYASNKEIADKLAERYLYLTGEKLSIQEIKVIDELDDIESILVEVEAYVRISDTRRISFDVFTVLRNEWAGDDNVDATMHVTTKIYCSTSYRIVNIYFKTEFKENESRIDLEKRIERQAHNLFRKFESSLNQAKKNVFYLKDNKIV